MKKADPEARPKIRDLSPGQIVGGKYRIERQLGAGGMGIVFAANDLQLRRKVAIKAMAPALAADPGSVKRFLREARSVVRLRGEHNVRVFDVGELPSGVPYIAMEFLVGTDLESLVAGRGRLPFRDAADFVIQALEGIAEAHAAGIVHRDLKPANLFLTRRSDGSSLVKVLDFGLAKAGELSDETALTTASTVMGTQHYMSPEQLRGSRDVDARTDIWALGVCLYQLTTGAMPFDVAASTLGGGRRPRLEALGELSHRIRHKTPRPPHEVVAGIPRGLSGIILRCLEKDPERRFESVAELASDLEMFASPEFIGVGVRLESVLEGETPATDEVHARALLALDTIPESGPERTTERMDRGGLQRARMLAEDIARDGVTAVRGWWGRLDVARARSFVSAVVRDRRSLVIAVVVFVLTTLAAMLVVVIVNERTNRGETNPAAPESPTNAPSRTTSSRAVSTTTDAIGLGSNAAPLPTNQPLAPAPVSDARSAAPSVHAPPITPAPSAEVSAASSVAPSADPSPGGSAGVDPTPPEPAASLTVPSTAHVPSTRGTVSRPASTGAPPSRMGNCNPPYVKNPDGKILWKPECL